MKRILIPLALAISTPVLNLQAAAPTSPTTVTWAGANHTPTNLLWSVPGNWSLNRVPSCAGTNAYGDKADFNSSTQPPCFLNSAALPSQLVMGDGNPSVLVILSGGSLSTSNYSGVNSYNAIGYSSLARLELRNGGSLVSSNHLWIGLNNNARGNFVMNGGTASVLGMTGLGWSGGIGILQVNGGTLNLAQWSDTASISALSQLDIREGTVNITGDHTASIANYIAGGQLTGYGGVGTVSYSLVTNATSTQTVVTATAAPGAGGPYAPGTWPTNINPNLVVHYWTVDPSLPQPNANWNNCLGLVAGGDQATTPVTLQGLAGQQATQPNINVYDQNWTVWNTNGLIDVLLSLYGDANMLRSAVTDPNQCRRFQFLEGTLPTDSSSTVYGNNLIPTNAYNSQWNWLLFTITNNLQSNLVDRLVGSLRTNATGSTNFGGINGGTIRLQGPDNNMQGITVRAVAFGQHGAFGTAPDINQFALPNGSCPPVLDANLVGIDINAGTSNYLQVINDPATDQGVTYVSNLGPPTDQRKAVIPTGDYLNFGILSNYLGQACNDNVTMKVCVDYYDDPAYAGGITMFGPYNYATDSLGDVGTLPGADLVLLQGTGQWVRRSWTISNVNLMGVNTAPLTGGPQFYSLNGQVAVSRCEIAVLRAVGPLAGQDPLATCWQDPNICLGVYGNYAELDLANGVTNGVDVGTSGGDQTEVVEMAGPAGDQRLSVSPNYAPSYYLNFQILTNALGPDSQGNVYLAMTATYYDDPALAGLTFWPQVWHVQQFNSTSFAYMSSTKSIVLQGTGKWRDAYWEIGSIFLQGVGQAHAAARFQCNGPLHICRIRYAVIRPCGATAGQNLLSNPVPLAATPDTNGLVRVSWPYRAPQAALQGIPAFGSAWGAVGGTPAVEGGDTSVLRITPGTSQFYRLNLTPQ
ncbi:MAG TPA: hypothetical protein VMU04_14195 [Candidatus Acidoferrum sp.]|nr:hypothetical protein [Candidatus Acidoferrum sp.]